MKVGKSSFPQAQAHSLSVLYFWQKVWKIDILRTYMTGQTDVSFLQTACQKKVFVTLQFIILTLFL